MENYRTDFIRPYYKPSTDNRQTSTQAWTMAANMTLNLVLGNPAQLCKAYHANDIINQEVLLAKQVKPPVRQGT